jgi:enoyl-CoA hydratase/carnithine racemase
MTEPILLRNDSGPVAVLTLNAPASLNALSDAMLTALADGFARLAEDRQIRVVILRGAGKAFCAGHDLKEMQAARAAPDRGRAAFADLFARCAAVMQAIPALPQPVIAQVHGIATAAGCQLVASCDMAVAAEGTRFGVNGVNIGLFCSTPMVALTRAVPRKAAFEMLTTGQFIPAGRAAEIGLINRVVPPEALATETRALADLVAGKLTAAVRIGKSAFYDQIGLGLAEAYDHTGAVMLENMMWRDTEEGISAFLEKRAPDWPAEAKPQGPAGHGSGGLGSAGLGSGGGTGIADGAPPARGATGYLGQDESPGRAPLAGPDQK